MDRSPFRKREWMKLGSAQGSTPATRPSKQATPKLEGLEERVVLSSASAILNEIANLGAELGGFGGGGGGGNFGGGFGGYAGYSGYGNFGLRPGPSGGVGIGGAGSSTLAQDTVKVNQAYATFNSTVLGDVATLRQTATTTSAPTAAGLTAYNNAIAAAISTLNTSITSDLSNLTNTGAAITSTIEGYTSTLQTELQSAGAGLANSTNSSVLSLYREDFTYIQTASTQSTQAVLTDAPTGVITGTAVQTANTSVRTALQTFTTAINTAKQTAITNGATLDSTAVTSAVSALQTSLNSAISSLGTGFTSSTYDPTTALNSALTSLTTQLTSITAPTAGNTSSARTFSFAINSALMNTRITGNQLVATAISNYNNSLL